ncbi:MAG: 6-phosphogluconolactonase [Euryarchaeota archaeon]|nr:6-phosphogluconolactonase [Euryarchaeota archaeon]MDE1836970.1 6-phosphogluconolactonase [Euryarchaeota archaeon]MDE1880790.1 6-phosphogluconolactonase [Euryarchaeota archaeon]MDE2045845.1 6-phosphogluconolactonase [Thermoplasmata archaeon]
MGRERSVRWVVGGDLSEVSHRLARHVTALARRSVKARGRFRFVLAGGNTPRELYRELAEEQPTFPWRRTWVYFGDDRLVPPKDPNSNFRMCRESFLSRVRVPTSQVVRVRGEMRPPSLAVENYANRLASTLEGPPPWFDLVLLGIGEDGHTASLFPSFPQLTEQEKLVALVRRSPEPPRLPRATLTLPALTSSKEVCFLTSGEGKAKAVRGIYRSLPRGSFRFPASLIAARAPTRFYLDREAATGLPLALQRKGGRGGQE